MKNHIPAVNVCLYVLFVLAVCTSAHAPSSAYIMWGNGGFQYILYENRQFFKLDQEGSVIQSSGTLYDKKSIKNIFDHLRSIKFDKCYSNNQQGNFYVIKVVTTEGEHQVAWVVPNDLGKKYNYRIPDFYSALMEFVR